MSATAQNFVYRCSMKEYKKVNNPSLTKEEIQRCIEVASKYVKDKEK